MNSERALLAGSARDRPTYGDEPIMAGRDGWLERLDQPPQQRRCARHAGQTRGSKQCVFNL